MAGGRGNIRGHHTLVMPSSYPSLIEDTRSLQCAAILHRQAPAMTIHAYDIDCSIMICIVPINCTRASLYTPHRTCTSSQLHCDTYTHGTSIEHIIWSTLLRPSSPPWSTVILPRLAHGPYTRHGVACGDGGRQWHEAHVPHTCFVTKQWVFKNNFSDRSAALMYKI